MKKTLKKKTLYVDMDNVLVDFPSAFPHLASSVRKKFKGRLDDVPGIFALMDALPDAVMSFRNLAKHFDTCIPLDCPVGEPVGVVR